MDRRKMGLLVVAACLAAASVGCNRNNGEQTQGSTSMQSNGSSDLVLAKGDAGGWSASQNGNTGPGPAASKDAGFQVVSPASLAVGKAGGSADPGDK